MLNNNMSWKFKEMLLRKNFKKIFIKRKVNSLYFDTFDYLFFKENIDGVGNRIKPRVRWYENCNEEYKFKKNYTIEIKKKNGFVGTKDIFRVDLKNDIEKKFFSFFEDDLSKKISSIVSKNVRPVLTTSYDREYFLNDNKKLRATIDTNLVIKNFKNNYKIDLGKEIMEIKYEKQNDNYFRNIIVDSNFNFRFQKYSKYVSGVLKLMKNGVI